MGRCSTCLTPPCQHCSTGPRYSYMGTTVASLCCSTVVRTWLATVKIVHTASGGASNPPHPYWLAMSVVVAYTMKAPTRPTEPTTTNVHSAGPTVVNVAGGGSCGPRRVGGGSPKRAKYPPASRLSTSAPHSSSHNSLIIVSKSESENTLCLSSHVRSDTAAISYELLAIYLFFVCSHQDCQRYRVCDAGASRAFH